MRYYSEIRPFEDEFELFNMPAVRIIGMEYRSGGALGNTAPALWDSVFRCGADKTLKALPHVLSDSLYGWTCEYDAKSDTFVYIVCAMVPAGTPIPDGYSYRDIPATVCAKGLYGESVSETIARAEQIGYEPNWEPYGWNAELYLQDEEDHPPKHTATPWHWLVPVREKA